MKSYYHLQDPGALGRDEVIHAGLIESAEYVLGNVVVSPMQTSRELGRIQLKSGQSCAGHQGIVSVRETHRRTGKQRADRAHH